MRDAVTSPPGLVVAIPGISGVWPGARDLSFAARFFTALYAAGWRGPFTPIRWPAAEWGLLSVVALPFRRATAEAPLTAALRAPDWALGRYVGDAVLVSHSLGTELTRGWLVRTGYRPRIWIIAGSYDGLLGQSRRAFVPGMRPWPEGVRAHVIRHPDDWWGGPLDGVPETVLAAVPGVDPVAGHAYWDDPRFAAAVVAVA